MYLFMRPMYARHIHKHALSCMQTATPAGDHFAIPACEQINASLTLCVRRAGEVFHRQKGEGDEWERMCVHSSGRSKEQKRVLR